MSYRTENFDPFDPFTPDEVAFLQELYADTGGVADNVSQVDEFTDLDDTPSVYTGDEDRLVTVNPTANGLIFGRKITISATEPSDPEDGDLWIDIS